MSNLELKGLKLLRNLDNALSIHENVILNEPLITIAVDNLVPGQYQPRKEMQESLLIELADSIRIHGIIQPLIVRNVSTELYEIIAGERRWRAAKIAGLACVPVIVKQIDDHVALAFSLIENIQRENLNPIEEALAFSRFSAEFKMTHEEIATMVGRSRAAITNSLRLLSLEPRVMKLLESGSINMGHARALLTLEPHQQYEVVCIAIEKQLNVREMEVLVKAYPLDSSQYLGATTAKYHATCDKWSKALSSKWSTDVSVKLNAEGKGKIVIYVNSLQEMERLIT